MSDQNAADEISYDLEDSYSMGLSYFSAVLAGDEEEVDLIEEQMELVELTGSLLQLNIVLLGKLLGTMPEDSDVDGFSYIESLRREHIERIQQR